MALKTIERSKITQNARKKQNIQIKQNSWDLETVISIEHKIPQQYFDEIPPEVITNFNALLSRDVFSEGDARPLFDYVMSRREEMSPEFLAMLQLWLDDELKHYEALRRAYHSLSGVSYQTMNRHFSERNHEIEPIRMLLEDEFTILVALMFDEIGSVYSYRRDLWEYYRHFGPAFKKIGHHLVKDEGMHFNNAAELLLSHHSHRLGEVEGLLKRISKLEKTLGKYYKTFFLDHAQEQYRFPTHFNQVIIRVILARLGLSPRPAQAELMELWQWAPKGHKLVPIMGTAIA